MILFKSIRLCLVLAAIAVLLACTPAKEADHDDALDDAEHAHVHEAGEFGRLLVYRTDGSLLVLDAADGDKLAQFEKVLLPGQAVINVGFNGDYAYVAQADSGRLAVVDSGFHLEDHGGHYDLELEEPALAGEISGVGRLTAFASSRGFAALYDESAGKLLVFNEASLREAPQARNIVSRPGGAELILTSDDAVLAYRAEPVVEIIDPEGRVRQRLPGGRNVQGQVRFGRFFAFGVEEGLLLLTWQGDYNAKILPLPATVPAGARVNRLRGHALVPHVVAGLDHPGYLVKATLPTEQLELVRLPAVYVDFTYDQTGKYLVMLGTDGRLYSLHPDTLEVIGSVAVAAAAGGQDQLLLVTGKAHAWVADPQTGQIVMVALDELEIEARFALDTGAAVGALGLLLTEGTRH